MAILRQVLVLVRSAFNLVLVSDVRFSSLVFEESLVHFFLDLVGVLVVDVLHNEFLAAEAFVANLALELVCLFFDHIFHAVGMFALKQEGVLSWVLDWVRALVG